VPGVLEPDVKAALDAGAEGVLYPLIRSAEDAERALIHGFDVLMLKQQVAAFRDWA
jgi:2-keto-3-deoxy-L-rhamnonate aldolase RhmA